MAHGAVLDALGQACSEPIPEHLQDEEWHLPPGGASNPPQQPPPGTAIIPADPFRGPPPQGKRVYRNGKWWTQYGGIFGDYWGWFKEMILGG